MAPCREWSAQYCWKRLPRYLSRLTDKWLQFSNYLKMSSIHFCLNVHSSTISKELTQEPFRTDNAGWYMKLWRTIQTSIQPVLHIGSLVIVNSVILYRLSRHALVDIELQMISKLLEKTVFSWNKSAAHSKKVALQTNGHENGLVGRLLPDTSIIWPSNWGTGYLWAAESACVYFPAAFLYEIYGVKQNHSNISGYGDIWSP